MVVMWRRNTIVVSRRIMVVMSKRNKNELRWRNTIV